MTDFEKLCAIYDKAGIGYVVGDAKMANFYRDKGIVDKAIEIRARDEYGKVNGYIGFTCHHTFDANGNLLSMYIWE